MNDINTIPHSLKYFAKNKPNKCAVIEGKVGNKCTYSELWDKIGRYAAYLKKHGLNKKEKVALHTSQTIEYISAYYGVMLAGGIAIPIEPTASEIKIVEVAEYFGASFILADRDLDTEIPVLSYESDEMSHEWDLPDNDSDTSVILYTTGTTGKSKGVVSSYKCRYSGADNVVKYYGITENDTALVPQLLSHSGGLRRVEAMFVAGATVVIMNPAMFFGDIFSAIKKYNCTVLQLVPAQVAQILNHAEKMLVRTNDQLRILSVGSAVIPETHKEKLRELLPDVRLFNDFGSTEAIGSAYFEWSAYPPKADCVGTEAIHSKIVFLDDNGNILNETSRSKPGTIATEGDTIMSEYYNEPELTASVLKNNRVVSADLGFRGEDGMIYICGRKTDIIVCGANKISPFEVEDAALQIEEIKECAVVGKSDDVMGQLPAIFYVSKGNYDIKYELFYDEMNKHLEAYKIPKPENVIRLEKLPKTEGTGKIIKRELENLLRG